MTLKQRQVSFENIWADLNANFSALFKHENMDKISAMDIFQNIYTLCIAKPQPYTEKLVQSIEEMLQSHISSILKVILESEDLVTCYAVEWKKYQQASMWMEQVCGYINKLLFTSKSSAIEPSSSYLHHLIQHRMTIEALALLKWKTGIIDILRKSHGDKLMKSLFAIVEMDRSGQRYDNNCVKLVSTSLIHIDKYAMDQPRQLYIEDFENIYVAQTREYYMKQAQILSSRFEPAEYLQTIQSLLYDEVLRSIKFCDESSTEKIIKECEHELISQQTDRIYPEFVKYVETENVQTMKLFFDLLSRLRNGTAPLVADFGNFVHRHTAKKLNDCEKDQRNIIECIVDSFRKFGSIVKEAFSDNPQFTAAIDKSLRSVINDTSGDFQIAEILAKFCDLFLKKSSSRSSSNIDDQINAVIIVFKYVDDKDLFQKFYARFLAKRLIFNTCISYDIEGSVIGRLKSVCGMEYTSKLQRMFQDVGVSSDLTREFLGKSQHIDLSFQILVLTAGAWPISAVNDEILVPRSFETSAVLFTNFYQKKFSGRKLTWIHNMSRAELRAIGFDKRYEINLSLYQASIMLEFNDTSHESFSLEHFVHALKISKSEVQKAMKPLVDATILSQNTSETEYSLNQNFTKFFLFLRYENFYNCSKRIKIKLASTSSTTSDAQIDSEITKKEVDEDRRLFLQAAIVRVMKSRKKISLNGLIQEVIQVSKDRFLPSIPMLKKSIEQLIEKQYIERSENDEEYIYAA